MIMAEAKCTHPPRGEADAYHIAEFISRDEKTAADMLYQRVIRERKLTRAYLMGITKVNPFTYDLSFNRFYSTDRIEALKLADIDSDLECRDLLVGSDGKSGYLYQRWGNKAAQVSTRGKIRLKSASNDTNRYFNGSVEKEIEQICKKLPDAGQGITDEQFLMGFEDEDGNHIDGL